MKVALRGIVAVLATALVCGACQAPNNGAKPNRLENQKVIKTATADWNPQPRENIRDGGQLTATLASLPDQFNVWATGATVETNEVWGWYNPILMHHSAEGDWYYDKNYLTKVDDKVENNKTVVTFTFRKEAKFIDNTPMDWRTIEAVWKACSGDNKAYECTWTDGPRLIESVTKGADDKQAVVTFKTPYPWWKSIFTTVLHPKALDPEVFNKGYKASSPHKEWGAGPFRLSSVDVKEGVVTFLRNDEWWGDRPKLDKVVLKAYEDDAAINAFRNGQTDTVGVTTKDYLAQVRDLANIEVRKGSRLAWTMLALNAKSPKLTDPNIRKAIVMSIDRKVIQDIAFNGLEFSEPLAGSAILFPYQKGYRDNWAKAVPYDVNQANQILEEAGWKKGSDGQRTKDGQKLELAMPYFSDSAEAKARNQGLAAMLSKNLGITVTADLHPSDEFDKYVGDRNFDMIMEKVDANNPYGIATMQQMYESTSDFNITGTSTPELDQKMTEMAKLPTAEEQARVANDIEVDEFRTYGWVPLINGIEMIACKKGLANYGASALGSVPMQDIGWQS